MLEMVYDYNNVDEANGALFTIEDIIHVDRKGDKLVTFQNVWDSTIAGQAKPLDEEEVILPLLLRQLRRSAHIKGDIMHYDRAEPRTLTISYRFLYTCLSRRIELNRQNSNRSALIANR